MKKRFLYVPVVIAALSCSIVAISSLLLTRNVKSDTGNLSIDNMVNIELKDVKSSNDGNTITVNYTIKPEEIKKVNFNSSLTWQENDSDNYESTDWHVGKNTDDYVSYSLNQDTKTLVFNCNNPFGRQMVFTLASPYNENVKASLTLDYARRQTKDASAVFDIESIKDNALLSSTRTYPEFSIGSTGTKELSNFSYKTYYSGNSKNTFDMLFSTISTTGLYAQSFKYNDKEYTDATSLRSDIIIETEKYLTSLFDIDNPRTFNLTDLEKVLSYKYAAYSMGSTVVFLNSAALYRPFMANYNNAYQKGYGIKSEIYYGETKLTERIFNIEADESELTEINIGDIGITF